MIIKTNEFVDMFGNSLQKESYYKNNKLATNTKNSIINNAKLEYDSVNYLGNGLYEILCKFENKLGKPNKRYKDYDFIKYSKTYDKLNGVYSIRYNDFIYIGSTTIGFRNRHLCYLYNKNCGTRQCLGDDLFQSGGVIDILWSTSNTDEFEIRNKEFEFIEIYKNKLDVELVNKSDNISVLKSDILGNIRKITIKSDDYDKVYNLLKKNNIKFV